MMVTSVAKTLYSTLKVTSFINPWIKQLALFCMRSPKEMAKIEITLPSIDTCHGVMLISVMGLTQVTKMQHSMCP